jgi:sugar phosphate isomerase/epimerase
LLFSNIPDDRFVTLLEGRLENMDKTYAQSALTSFAQSKGEHLLVPGLCSLTLKQCSPREVLDLALRGGLQTIEWWGSGHVPPGDFSAASEIGHMTRDMGLSISTYGSYYRVGTDGPPAFEVILDTAVAVGAPSIRVWAGNKNRADADSEAISRVVRESLRIADLAAEQGVSMTFEFHSGTLTDSGVNAHLFAEALPHPNIHFSWQPSHGFTTEKNLPGLEGLASRLLTLHVFHWTIGSYQKNLFDETERPPRWTEDFFRHPLVDGTDCWRRYLTCAASTGRRISALLEFVREDSPENFLQDAGTLVRLCHEASR